MMKIKLAEIKGVGKTTPKNLPMTPILVKGLFFQTDGHQIIIFYF
jgi:hypothetical protein